MYTKGSGTVLRTRLKKNPKNKKLRHDKVLCKFNLIRQSLYDMLSTKTKTNKKNKNKK